MPLGGERLSSSGIELWSTKVFQSFIAFSYQKGHVLRVPLLVVRRACSTANGCKSRPNLMEAKGSEAQGRRREVGSEGSVEQRYGPMDKNWI